MVFFKNSVMTSVVVVGSLVACGCVLFVGFGRFLWELTWKQSIVMHYKCNFMEVANAQTESDQERETELERIRELNKIVVIVANGAFNVLLYLLVLFMPFVIQLVSPCASMTTVRKNVCILTIQMRTAMLLALKKMLLFYNFSTFLLLTLLLSQLHWTVALFFHLHSVAWTLFLFDWV